MLISVAGRRMIIPERGGRRGTMDQDASDADSTKDPRYGPNLPFSVATFGGTIRTDAEYM
jgi:hypothetical protein